MIILMRKRIGIPVIAALLLVVLFSVPVAAASDPTVTIKVIGADGGDLTNAKVVLYDDAGHTYEGTTNATGYAVITVPENGTYLIVVDTKYVILDTVTVEGDTSKTVNATAMHYANVSSTPLVVDVDVMLLAFENVSVSRATNFTVYAPSSINLTFPEEIYEFPWKYEFQKVTYDTTEKNATEITLDMAANYVVTAEYTKTFGFVLEYWMLLVLIAVVVIAIAIAVIAASRHTIMMIRERSRKFVEKKSFVKGR